LSGKISDHQESWGYELRALILNLPDRLPEFKKPSLIKQIDYIEGFIAAR
jgi:hypothetical protein